MSQLDEAETGVMPTSQRPGFWAWLARHKLAISLAALGGLLVLGVAGVAYATYDYSKQYDGKILPGSSIAGVDVSGMTPDEALAAVKQAVGPQLDRPISVTYRGHDWVVTPRELGARSDARSVVDAALEASGNVSFVEKAKMRVLGEVLDFEQEVAVSYPRKGVATFVDEAAAEVDRDPVDAAIDYSTGWVEITPEQTGRELNTDASRRTLRRAILGDAASVTLPVKELQPEVTTGDLGQILLVRIGENKLYLYEEGEITHSWTVATGQPEYMTPTGVYEITEKRYMPTWINPAPDTWGADLPESIPPGPSNPLGLRALNWSAPAIRFHGTSAIYSLGYNASHGCVRMSNDDVIQLYDMIEVGTPIVSTVAGPLKPMYVSSPDPTPVPDDGEEENSDGGRGDGRNNA